MTLSRNISTNVTAMMGDITNNKDNLRWNKHFLAAQCVSIPASLFSIVTILWAELIDGLIYVMFIPLIVANVVGIVLFQMSLCCCLQRRCFLYTVGCLAVFLSVSMLAIGIFIFNIHMESPVTPDLGVVAVVEAILWAIAASQMFVFVRSDQYTKWEEKQNNAQEQHDARADNDVESSIQSLPDTITASPIYCD